MIIFSGTLRRSLMQCHFFSFFALRTFLIMIALCPACAVFSHFNCPSGLCVCVPVCVCDSHPFPVRARARPISKGKSYQTFGLLPRDVFRGFVWCSTSGGVMIVLFFLFFFFSLLQYTQLHVRNCMRMGIEVITHTYPCVSSVALFPPSVALKNPVRRASLHRYVL